ncbi:MAG: ABC transporter permease subunit [Isosphaeraceae bacterium]
MNLLEVVAGPLVPVECRRAVGRGWLILIRALGAVALVGVATIALWVAWLVAQTDPHFNPETLVRVSVLILECLALAFAMILAPAFLAGSLAGERERGSLPLLLTTSVNPREIVLGRFAGKLSQVLMVLLAGLPAQCLLGMLADLNGMALITLIALPIAVAFGAAGMSAAASVLSKRGRDALMSMYLLFVLVLLSRLLLPFLPKGSPVALISPFNMEVLYPFLWQGRWQGVWWAILGWTLAGILGITIAAWRLRPACIGGLSAAPRREKGGRFGWVPAVGDKPMLWKELFIERSNTLGKFGAVVGIGLLLFLVLGSVGIAGTLAYFTWYRPDSARAGYLTALMGWLYAGWAATVLGFLIEAAVGLRAGVAIASERERNTWDGLLTSPLEGREIVNGKLLGSLYALRWLFAATLLAWSMALIAGAMDLREFLTALVLVICVGAFLAAAGVRTSLATSTATRSMSVTIGLWMAAGIGIFAASWILSGLIALFWLFCWWMAVRLQIAPATAGVWAPISISDLQVILAASLYILATLMLASESRLRFDRIAGRMAGGEVQVGVDQIFHGQPMAPVHIDDLEGRPRSRRASEAPATANVPTTEAVP